MIKIFLAITYFLFVATFCLGQKYMVTNGDTLPYSEKMFIQTDTLYFGKSAVYPGDTLYEGTCWTFEKVRGKIINQTDVNCLRQGYWIIEDSLGNYQTLKYDDGEPIGVQKFYAKNGKLLREIESISIQNDEITIKEIDYTTGHTVTVTDKPFLEFYLKNSLHIALAFFLSVFIRVPINSKIYNVENGTNYSPVYFNFGLITSTNYKHSLASTFTFCFFNFKPENRTRVIISNILSVISLGIFFSVIIGLAVTGEL